MIAAAAEKRFSWLDVFAEASARVGGRVDWVDETGSAGLIALPGNRTLFFHKGVLDLNGVASARVAKDKNFTNQFLRSRGYEVPEERTFFHNRYAREHDVTRGPEAAAEYAAELGYPVYVKPVHLSQGRCVVKARDVYELRKGIEYIHGADTVYLVQRAYGGIDIRAIAVHGEVLFGFERSPLTVIGDGVLSIAQLLDQKQRSFVEGGRDTVIDVTDWRLLGKLRDQRKSLTDVAARGVSIVLHDVTNLSCGGTAAEKTDIVKARLGDIVRRISFDMHLGFCGIDFIVDALDQQQDRPLILEVNSAPGLDHYLYDSANPLEEVQSLYAKLLHAYMETRSQWRS